MRTVLEEIDDPATRYASASDGLDGYDQWKTTEPRDDDQFYFDTWDEAEKRAMEMKRNALEMIRNEEIYQETWTRYPNPKTTLAGNNQALEHTKEYTCRSQNQ